VFVNLRHTREIERESGGFARYLQNQNNNNYYYYNYGRPLENYRDRFQEGAEEALSEHFEVLSVTFNGEDAHSKATEEYGWRVTPYAYLLVKPRGPRVDKIPPLRLDLDFLDTSGYAIIPVESPPVPIDASAKRIAQARPATKIAITQTLDERQAEEGKLVLEVKATALGLVPSLADLVEPAKKGAALEKGARMGDFTVAAIEDEGVSVSRFEPESDETAVASERIWLVTLAPVEGLTEPPKTFQFPIPKVETVEKVYQRYVDADLVSVEPTVSLEEEYGKPSYAWAWWLLAIPVLAVAAVFAVRGLRRGSSHAASGAFEMPETINAFTVLGLLERIEANNGLSDAGRAELRSSIARLERHYFADDGDAPDLRQLAESWIAKTLR
jgi:hypothetical protein